MHKRRAKKRLGVIREDAHATVLVIEQLIDRGKKVQSFWDDRDSLAIWPFEAERAYLLYWLLNEYKSIISAFFDYKPEELNAESRTFKIMAPQQKEVQICS